MVNWVNDSNFIAGCQPILDVSTTQRHPLGTIISAHDSDATLGFAEFIYLKGVASTAIGTWVIYNLDDWTTTRLAATAIGPVAIAMAANTAATSYAWYQITGKAIGACLTLFADNADVWCTATAGSVDDASVAGDTVSNAKGASTTVVSSGTAEFEISRPFCTSRAGVAI